MTKIKDKTVLVTGGAAGMGRLMAIKCLEKKAKRAILWDIDEDALNKTTAELEDLGYEIHPYVVDVSNIKHIEWAAKYVLETVGPVDILFNNAGIVVGKDFVDHSDADLTRTININVLGVMRVTRAFLPTMIEEQQGHIINIASAAGLIPNPKMSVYASSKWAVLGWSESLRLELEAFKTNKLQVTTVTPSYINTGMFDGVKAPMLTPMLEPDFVVSEIIKAVEKNKIILRKPFIVNTLPLLRGLLPAKIFDKVAETMGVYKSMDKFKGRKKEKSTKTKITSRRKKSNTEKVNS